MSAARQCKILSVLAALASGFMGTARAREPDVSGLRAYDLPGYTIITHDDNTASKMVPSIAAVEQVLSNLLSRDIAPTGRPTHVYIVRLGLWRRYLQPADLFSGEFHATRFADYLMAANSGDRAEVRRSVMHLFTHRHMHTQYGGVYPLWFDEGLAELMSVAELRTSQVLLGQVHLSGNAWIPLNRLLRIDRSAPEYLSMVSSGSLHAESWALVHQAFIGEPALKEQMLAYLRDANDLMPVDDAVQKNFRMDVSQLNAKVMAYANDPSWRTDSVPFTRIPTPELGAGREIPEDEALVMLATAMLDTGSRPDRVGEVIDSLEKQAPGSPAAWSLRMRMAARDRDDALLDQLWNLIEPKTQAPTVARDAGFALFERIQRERENDRMPAPDRAGLRDRAFALLDRALAANPDDVEASWAYAKLAADLKRDLDKALQRLKHASELMPKNAELASAAALLHEARGDTGAMIASLEDTVRFTSSLELKLWARERLGKMRVGAPPLGSN